jgi:hypothetical protein
LNRGGTARIGRASPAIPQSVDDSAETADAMSFRPDLLGRTRAPAALPAPPSSIFEQRGKSRDVDLTAVVILGRPSRGCSREDYPQPVTNRRGAAYFRSNRFHME